MAIDFMSQNLIARNLTVETPQRGRALSGIAGIAHKRPRSWRIFMQFSIEDAIQPTEAITVRYIEDSVFRREKRIDLPPLAAPRGASALSILARDSATGQPAGALTVVETTSDRDLLARYGVRIESEHDRIARYTRLAVLPAYRGYGLSIRLILEARRRFVEPHGINRTWLLFDASRASSSLIASVLGFECGVRIFRAEYGLCRLLSRNENGLGARQSDQRGWTYLESFSNLHALEAAA
jgi:GNAT superfamily N-acetyltransferase